MQQGFEKTEALCEEVIPSCDAALSGDAALCDEASLNPALYFYQEFTHTLQDNKNSFSNRHRWKSIYCKVPVIAFVLGEFGSFGCGKRARK